jgi:hypothetical protein
LQNSDYKLHLPLPNHPSVMSNKEVMWASTALIKTGTYLQI